MKKQTREQRPGIFPGTLWTSTGRIRNELKCEEEYYQQELCSSESPSVKYRLPESKPPGRLAAGRHDRQSRKRRVSKIERHRGAESSGDLWEEDKDEAMHSRPFTSSLRQKFQMDSREALCLLGLKKKIARMFAENVSTLDEIHRCTLGSGSSSGTKRPSPPTAGPETTPPVKRRRGRPPKKKPPISETKTPVPLQTPVPDWTCVADNRQPLRVKISRSQSSDAAILRDGVKAVGDTLREPRPLRKTRTAERTPMTMFADLEETSSASTTPNAVSSPLAVDDEALALQLHLDLNAPMLRRRRRSGGLLSPSSSEQ